MGHELRKYNSIYASHVRSEAAHVIDAVSEAILIGERAGVPVQVSHLKVIGKAQHGRMGELLVVLEAARRRGVLATADAYPYIAGSAPLMTMLPPWIQGKGVDDTVNLLRSHEVQLRIRSELDIGLPGWDNELQTVGGWDGLRLTHIASQRFAWARGLRISAAAERNESSTSGSVDPLTFALDLLVEDRCATWIVGWGMSEPDMLAALAYPWTTIGSDQAGVLSADSRVHPRGYGAFARVLGWAVREAQLFSVEDAVLKMTGLAADAIGLRDRGRIAPGLIADIVVFDPRQVTDRATFEDPTRPATGIEHVLVNGQLAVADGKVTGQRSGRVLRKSPGDGGGQQCRK